MRLQTGCGFKQDASKSMKQPPLVIWDWNGTLLDDVDAGVQALNKMLVARHLPTITHDFYRAHFGFPVRPFYTLIGMDPDAEWERICVEFHVNLHAARQGLRPDARAALETVRAHGGRQVVLSALREDLLLRDTAAAGVQAFFEAICGVDDLSGATKLARGHELLQHLAFTPSSASRLLFIGDTLHDAEVATALGATALLVEGGHQSTARLRAAGCPVVPALLDAARMACAAL